MNNSTLKYSPQIDGLRAFAVLAVIIYHGFPGYLNGGFLGVDVFFVISGYLITRLILNNLQNKKFTFKEFYYRRIKRILPALIVMLIMTLIFGGLVLFPDEYKSLGIHIFGGATFISNFILYSEIGYFDPDSHSKPLLHLWSLAIEEQFYIIWPIMLFLFWKFSLNIFNLICTVLIISFSINLYLIYTDSGLAFYFPFARFWELMFGSILSNIELSLHNSKFEKSWKNIKAKTRNVLSMLAFALIIIVMSSYSFFDDNKLLPYFIVVLSTFIIIGFGENTIVGKKILSNRIMVYIGLISYPLYLLHWPILSFSFIVSDGFPSGEIRFLLIVISFFLSALTFKYIEKPIRYKSKDKFNSKISMNLIIPIILLGLIGSLVFSNDGIPRRITNKLGMDNSMVTYEPDTKHMVSNKNIVIIGDSHAQQFGESLNISGFTNVKVFSKGTCFPFLGLNTLRQPTRLWKQGTDCQPWVDNSYSEIGRLVNTEIVIIACFYNQYLDGRIIINSDGKDDAHPVENFNNGINKTIEYLLSKNKKVVLALDVPELNGPCMPPRPFIFNSEKNCLIKKENESLQSNIYSNIIKNISDNNKNIYMYDPRGALCDEKHCYGKIDEVYFYNSDGNHLNQNGLIFLGNHFNKIFHTDLEVTNF